MFYPNIDSTEISTRKGNINNFVKSAWRIISLHKISHSPDLGELIGINDTWLRFRDQKEIESQDELDSMQYSGIYLLSQNSKLEYVRNRVLVVIGKP